MSINQVIDHTCNGCCSGCGNCCSSFLPLTKDELSTIKEYVKEHNIPMKNRNLPNGFDANCTFLDSETHKCKIYEVRPYVCKHFICSDKDWKSNRDKYMDRAYYNKYQDGHFVNMADFDDLIYDNPELLIRIIGEMVRDKDGTFESDKFKLALKIVGREDILDCVSFE